MNKALESLLERVAAWPAEAQEELLQSIVDIEIKHFGVYRLSADERAAVREGLAQAERGEFAPDEAVAEFFKRYAR